MASSSEGSCGVAQHCIAPEWLRETRVHIIKPLICWWRNAAVEHSCSVSLFATLEWSSYLAGLSKSQRKRRPDETTTESTLEQAPAPQTGGIGVACYSTVPPFQKGFKIHTTDYSDSQHPEASLLLHLDKRIEI